VGWLMPQGKSKQSARAYHLLRKYGITEDQYSILLFAQDGHCALCTRRTENSGKNLSVDHNHKTGEIRGLLCYRCNKFVIGRHTDPYLLEAAAAYLRKSTGWFVPPKPKKRKRRKRK
jgi:Recombination endonuclease VII